jgi:glycosyltransferase involved in cell wall biosynthesis
MVEGSPAQAIGTQMISGGSHISVCVCTYKRPAFLTRLLEELDRQETSSLFTFSIVVADNDDRRSAETVVRDFAVRSMIPIRYCVQPRQNIALTRNTAVEHAAGDFVAFIDDDEFPDRRWLLTLFEACHEYDAAGVIGPVRRHFDDTPPAWVVKGRFYERPRFSTGSVIDWTMGRTNNVLLKREVLAADAQPFRPEFRTGEDQDFFRRMIDKGFLFIWCDEAIAYEVVPPIRWKRTFMLRRALLQGTVSVLHPTFGRRAIAKSVIAVPAYLAALPVSLMFGQSRFMTVLVKLCDHLGRLLAAVGINAIREPYVTD